MIFGSKFKKNTPSKSMNELIKDAKEIIDLRVKLIKTGSNYYDKVLTLYNSINKQNIEKVYSQIKEISDKCTEETNIDYKIIKSKDISDIQKGIKYYINNGDSSGFSSFITALNNANKYANSINSKYGKHFSSSDDAYYYTEDTFAKNNKVSKIDPGIGQDSVIIIQEIVFMIADNIEGITDDYDYYNKLL